MSYLKFLVNKNMAITNVGVEKMLGELKMQEQQILNAGI